jgi:ATP phosphoribosyltransferase
MSNLRIGVPSKGRLAESVSELMDEAGLKFRRSDRRLFARVRDMPIDVVFLRAHDIPVLCAEGALDLGVTTRDKLEESGQDVGDRIIHRLNLGFGHCRMAFCVPEDSPFQKPQISTAPASPRVTPLSFSDILTSITSAVTSLSSVAPLKS